RRQLRRAATKPDVAHAQTPDGDAVCLTSGEVRRVVVEQVRAATDAAGRELSRSQARGFPLADVADHVVHPSIPRRGGLTGLAAARGSYRVVEGLPGVPGRARILVAVGYL